MMNPAPLAGSVISTFLLRLALEEAVVETILVMDPFSPTEYRPSPMDTLSTSSTT